MHPPQYTAEFLRTMPPQTFSQHLDGTSTARKAFVLCLCSANKAMEMIIESLADTISVRREDTLSKFRRAMRETAPDVILCPWSFPAGTWIDVIGAVEDAAQDTPVIVVAEGDPEYAWSWQQVVERGGFDLLAPPFKSSITFWVLHQAVESHIARQASRSTRAS